AGHAAVEPADAGGPVEAARGRPPRSAARGPRAAGPLVLAFADRRPDGLVCPAAGPRTRRPGARPPRSFATRPDLNGSYATSV
ncbi:hypothetical protein QCN29_03400, partial [Streptomyces sp. HNM0663]